MVINKMTFGIEDFYFVYRKRREKLLRPLHNKIVKLFFKKMVHYLYQGYIIPLPSYLGDLYIKKYKPKLRTNKNNKLFMSGSKAVDYKKTKELWKNKPELAHKTYLYYENDHSDGYKFALRRTKFKPLLLNKIYNFVPSRTFSLGLAKEIFKDPHKDFIL